VEKEHEKDEGNGEKGNASEILHGNTPNFLQSPATPAPLLTRADADLTQGEVLPTIGRIPCLEFESMTLTPAKGRTVQL
jgi:hypothetical protein